MFERSEMVEARDEPAEEKSRESRREAKKRAHTSGWQRRCTWMTMRRWSWAAVALPLATSFVNSPYSACA